MIAPSRFIFLTGKDFSIPPGIEFVVIGLFLGVVGALFFYQDYRRNYYWWFSVLSGILSALIARKILGFVPGIDLAAAGSVVMLFVIPCAVVLAVNLYLASIKKKFLRRRKKEKTLSQFFEELPAKPNEISKQGPPASTHSTS